MRTASINVIDYVTKWVASADGRDAYIKAVRNLIYFLENSKIKEVGVKIYEIGDDKIASVVRVAYSCMMPVPNQMKKRNFRRTLTPGHHHSAPFLPVLLASFAHDSSWQSSAFDDQICQSLLEDKLFSEIYDCFKNEMESAVHTYLHDPDQIEIVQSKIKKFQGRIKNRQANELKALLRKLAKCSWDGNDVINSWREIQCEEIMES